MTLIYNKLLSILTSFAIKRICSALCKRLLYIFFYKLLKSKEVFVINLHLVRGIILSLTTPVPRDDDAVFPGENWFLYWKTSASLWRSKLESFPGVGKIIVPINWSFHSETGDKYDFAQTRPETDLKKLASLAEELGREVVFLLPLTPVPYLPNGGIPSLLARTISLDKKGVAYGILDSDGGINKIYSYFDPRVYQSFSKFTQTLGRYISEQGIACDIWGMQAGYFEEHQFTSYIEDRSRTFERAFSRFLAAKKEEEGEDFENSSIESPEEESLYKSEFIQTINELYVESASNDLSSNWEGVLKVGFLGGGELDLFSRMYENDSSKNYSLNVFNSIAQDIIPSSILLPQRKKMGVLGRQINELITTSYLQLKLRPSFYEEEDITSFAPLSFFELYSSSRGENELSSWRELGVQDFLDERYRWCFKEKDISSLLWDESSSLSEKITFVSGRDIDQTKFHTVLKLFMNGGKVIIDRSGMADKHVKRLEAFFLENSLQVEKINFHTMVHNAILGEGRLLIFEGDKLKEISSDKTFSFWEKLLSTFSIFHAQPQLVEGIEFAWRTRSSAANELNYEEVRRFSLYNPTSYKKKVKFSLPKNFVLMKVMDEINVKVQTGQHEVDVELLPEGSLSLDFGIFS